MTEEEDFQFIISRQDYLNLKNLQAQNLELAQQKTLIEGQSQEKTKNYLSRIENLEDELKIFRNSILQHTEIEVNEIQKVLKALKNYRVFEKNSYVTENSLQKIKHQLEKISQTFDIQLNDFRVVNFEIKAIIKKLIQDSMNKSENLNSCLQNLESTKDEKQNLYANMRQSNEKLIFLNKQKQSLLRSEDKLKNENQILRHQIDEVEKENNQLSLNIKHLQEQFKENNYILNQQRLYLKQETKKLKQQNRQLENEWKTKNDCIRMQSNKALDLLQQDHSQSVQIFKAQTQSLKAKVCELQKQLMQNQKQLIEMKNVKQQKIQTLMQMEYLRRMINLYEEDKATQQLSLNALRQEIQILKKSKSKQKNVVQKEIESLEKQLKTSREEKNLRRIEMTSIYDELKNQRNSMIKLTQKLHNIELLLKIQQQKSVQNTFSLNCEIANLSECLQQLKQSNFMLSQQNNSLIQQKKFCLSQNQSSNLMKMQFETVKNQLKSLKKQYQSNRKDNDGLKQQLTGAKEEIKYSNQDNKNMKDYIDELQKDLMKINKETNKMKAQLDLVNEETLACKEQNIQQMFYTNKLEKQIKSLNLKLQQAENQDLSTIARKSSLSKGSKGYYVKEMLQAYANEIKKDLVQMQALSPQQIKALVSSEMKELANYVKKLENDLD